MSEGETVLCKLEVAKCINRADSVAEALLLL